MSIVPSNPRCRIEVVIVIFAGVIIDARKESQAKAPCLCILLATILAQLSFIRFLVDDDYVKSVIWTQGISVDPLALPHTRLRNM